MQMSAFQRSLNRYLRNRVATAEEMAEVVDRSPQHIRAVARGDTSLPHEKVEQLSSWLVDERGVTEHVNGMLGVSGATHFHPDEVDNDDCIQDEIYSGRQRGAAADNLLKAGDRQEAARQMKEAIKQFRAALADIEQPA